MAETQTVRSEGFPDLGDEVLYPRLSDAKLAWLAKRGKRRAFGPGEVLYEHAVRNAPFYVIEHGLVEFIDRKPGKDVYIAQADARTFIGDIAAFTGEPTLSACVAVEPTDVIMFDRSGLRDMLARWPEFGEHVFETLLARRAWHEAGRHGVMRLIAPRGSRRAFEVRDLLERNLLPVRFYDVDTDAEAAAVLDWLNIPASGTPVLLDRAFAESRETGAVEVVMPYALSTARGTQRQVITEVLRFAYEPPDNGVQLRVWTDGGDQLDVMRTLTRELRDYQGATMRIHKARVLRSCTLAVGALAVTAASATAAPTSPIVGHAYVDGNTPVANTVAELDRHADGSLTPTPGSPFAAGGAGTGAGLASQGAIQLARHGRYLLVADAGSNQISVLRIRWKGVPTEVGAPVSSGGVDPNSIAVHRDLVYVANSGSPNYTGFRLTRSGQLLPIAQSTVTVSSGSALGDVLFNRTGTTLVGTEVTSSQIDSFSVGWDGRLHPAPGSPYTGQGLGQLGAEFNPTNPSQLFVSNAHNGTGLGTVSSYHVGFSGSLNPVSASPFADGQTAPCWVTISRDGRYLFAVNTGSKNISSYAIDRFGQLTLISSFAINGSTGGDIDARLSPDGRSLLVVGGKSDVISAFAVNGGTLAEYPSSPTALPSNELAPSGIAVN